MVPHSGRRTETARAWHIAAGALRAATGAGGRTHADHALRQEAFGGIEQLLMRALEFGEGNVGGLGGLAGAFFAERAVGGEN